MISVDLSCSSWPVWSGFILVYNVAVEPKPADNALSRKLWERVGFKIVTFDQDDRGAAFRIGMQLGWEAQAAPLDENIRAMYTIVRRTPGR